jgi:hypothetical protein
MAPTENHEYSQPSKGTQDWDQPLNQNFAEIDTDVEVRDTGGPTEGQNSYTPADGAKYLDTDSGVVYTGDGSSWTATHALARFTPQGGGGTGNIVLGATSNTTDASAGNVVTGGQNNAAEGPYAAVGGGDGNSATGQEAVIPGGLDNTASGALATVGGGNDNEATDSGAAVGGGKFNAASANSATVAGGDTNTASANSATVGGGYNNLVEGEYATIAGGGPADTQNADSTRNVVYDDYGTIGGGGENQAGSDDGDTATATYATVGGGSTNTASGENATVGGGQENTASDASATVAGGFQNTASDGSTTVGGGFQNDATAESATVGGGRGNEATADSATVVGGRNNAANGQYSTAVGRNATADNDGAFVVGDATSTSVSSSFDNVALFQQNIVSEASITTGSSYEYDESSMSTSTFVNGADNDVWEVTSPGIYGTPISRLSVEETGDVGISGDLDVSGDITGNTTTVNGTLNRDLGVELTRDSTQSIPDDSETRVEFNDPDNDDRNEWDNTNFEFVAANDGVYHVDLGINFTQPMAADTDYIVRIYEDGFFNSASFNSTPPNGGAVSNVSVQFSTTVWNVSAGNNIYVTAQLDGDSNIIDVSYYRTWLNIVRLG